MQGKRFVASLLCLPLAATPAMQDTGTLRLRADTRVVQIDVTVRDSQGKPVHDLTKSDFTVTDNGKPRTFTIFSVNHDTPGPSASGSNAPQPEPAALAPRPALPPNVFTNLGGPGHPPEGHSTIILLDGMNGWFDNFAYARQGVLGLMNKVPADEQIALYVLSNGNGMGILQDYTTDRAKLTDAMAHFIPRGMHPAPPYLPEGAEGMIEKPTPDAPQRPRSGPGGPPPPDASKAGPLEQAASLQVASEAVRLSLNALAERLRTLPGRKTVFWVTQGFPPRQLRDMQIAWDKTITALNDANIVVNTVDDNGLGGPPRYWGPGAILTMQQIAEETGGQAYYHRNDLDGAMASGIADSRSSYTLGFYLAEMDGKYHELKVHADRTGLQLNYRQGYYARSEAMADLSSRKSDLQSALLNPLDSVGVGITASIDVAPGTPRATLMARLKLDPDSLSLRETPGGWNGNVEEIFLELNAAGRQVGELRDKKQFKIASGYKPTFDNEGVTLSQAVPLAADAVKLSIIVRDSASGRTGSLTVPLDKVSPHTTGN